MHQNRLWSNNNLLFESNTCVVWVSSALSSGVFPARNPALVGVLTVPRTIYQMVGGNTNRREIVDS